MNKIKCIAVDDEPLAIEQMKGFIAKVDFLNLAGTFSNAMSAMNFLKQTPVDLIFLDIEMDDFSGIEMLEAINKMPFVILTTAYDQYALKGYELQVIDYLLKPISFKRFIQAVDRVYGLMNRTENAEVVTLKSSSEQKNDFMFIKTEYKMQKVLFDDILHIKSMGNYLIIKTIHEEKIYTLSNFKQIEELLPSESFYRLHKSYIVQLNKIDSITKNSVEIQKEHIPIGDSYKQLFFNVLKEKKYI